MEEAYVKLSFVVILIAFASCLSPHTVEARHKHHHHHGDCHHHVDLAPVSPPPSAPTTTPVQPPQGSIPTYQIHGCGDPCSDSNDCGWPCTVCCGNQTCCCHDPQLTTPPSPMPNPPLSSGPQPPPQGPQPPSPPPSTGEDRSDILGPALAPAPAPSSIGVPVVSLPPVHDQFPPYQVRDCGYGACVDSNDCNPPCATCCANHTCCYDEFLFR